MRKKAVLGNPSPAVRKGYGGYADWMFVSINGRKTHLELPYPLFLDLLYKMSRIGRTLCLEVSQLPECTTINARMQNLKISLSREFLRPSAALHDTDEIQAVDSTGMDRTAARQQYAKWTDNTLSAVKTTALIDPETDKYLIYIAR